MPRLLPTLLCLPLSILLLANTPALADDPDAPVESPPVQEEALPPKPEASQPALKWTTDFPAAQAEAKQSGKPLLVNFTGSDWCFWCVRLKEEVFNTPAFAETAEKFVLVELDFPQNIEQPEALRAQNRKLAETYAVGGYPTILLLDANGRAFATTGYQRGGPEAYSKHLAELLKHKAVRDEKLAAAEKAEGLDKAALLDEALACVEESGVYHGYEGIIETIVTLDADDKKGLKTKYGRVKDRQAFGELQAQIEPLVEAEKFEEAIKKLDELIGTYKQRPALNQMAHVMKAYILFNTDKFDESIKTLEAALSLDPKSDMAERIPEFIKMVQAAKAEADEKPEPGEQPTKPTEPVPPDAGE